MKVTRKMIDEFLAQKTLALAGASRGGKKFGNYILKNLKAKGYEVLLVHPSALEIDGVACYPSLADLPKKVDGLVIVTPPRQTENLLREAAAAGIGRVWIQQGAESPEALQFCEENGISAIHNECIMMFAEPTAFMHRFHRWFWGLLGKLPEGNA